MRQGKSLFALLLLAAALIGGFYLAGGLLLWLADTGEMTAHWNTWLRYVQLRSLPPFAPFAHTILLAGGLGLGAPLLAWLLVLIALFRPRRAPHPRVADRPPNRATPEPSRRPSPPGNTSLTRTEPHPGPAAIRAFPTQDTPAMPNKAIQVMSATAALALAATATPSRADDAPASASTTLIRQAREDGLTIAQERYIQSLPKTPGYHWDGYSDKPVKASLGPNAFMFPMNLYDDQIGPDFQGSVALGLYWPELDPLPPGERRAAHYFEKYQDRLIHVAMYYVDKVPIDTLLATIINESPNQKFKQPPDDPSENRSLRIKGDPIYGLTPYYSDLKAITAYFNAKGIPSDRENVVRWADDWYLRYGDDGALNTVITCMTREEPGSVLKDRVLVTPADVHPGSCEHAFIIPEYSLDIRITYRRAFLKDWRAIEDRVRSLFATYHVANTDRLRKPQP